MRWDPSRPSSAPGTKRETPSSIPVLSVKRAIPSRRQAGLSWSRAGPSRHSRPLTFCLYRVASEHGPWSTGRTSSGGCGNGTRRSSFCFRFVRAPSFWLRRAFSRASKRRSAGAPGTDGRHPRGRALDGQWPDHLFVGSFGRHRHGASCHRAPPWRRCRNTHRVRHGIRVLVEDGLSRGSPWLMRRARRVSAWRLSSGPVIDRIGQVARMYSTV